MKNPQTELKKSKYPGWIRAVAALVVVVFLPEQAAWAMGYDAGVLWKPQQYIGAGQEGYVSNFVAENTKRSLEYLANKPLQKIKLSETLVVDAVTDPKSTKTITNREVKKAYEWLKAPNTQVNNYCGVYALNNYLKYNQKTASQDELTLQVVLVDILSSNIKDYKNKLRTSLFAVQKVAGAYGFELTGLKIDPKDLTNEALNSLTPFIAHLNAEHFIFVTRITPEKVYYLEKDKEESIGKEEVKAKFSGNILVEKDKVGTTAAAIKEISKEESLNIKGGADLNELTRSIKSAVGTVVSITTNNPSLGNKVATTSWSQSITTNPIGVAKTVVGTGVGLYQAVPMIGGSPIPGSNLMANSLSIYGKASGDTTARQIGAGLNTFSNMNSQAGFINPIRNYLVGPGALNGNIGECLRQDSVDRYNTGLVAVNSPYSIYNTFDELAVNSAFFIGDVEVDAYNLAGKPLGFGHKSKVDTIGALNRGRYFSKEYSWGQAPVIGGAVQWHSQEMGKSDVQMRAIYGADYDTVIKPTKQFIADQVVITVATLGTGEVVSAASLGIKGASAVRGATAIRSLTTLAKTQAVGALVSDGFTTVSVGLNEHRLPTFNEHVGSLAYGAKVSGMIAPLEIASGAAFAAKIKTPSTGLSPKANTLFDNAASRVSASAKSSGSLTSSAQSAGKGLEGLKPAISSLNDLPKPSVLTWNTHTVNLAKSAGTWGVVNLAVDNGMSIYTTGKPLGMQDQIISFGMGAASGAAFHGGTMILGTAAKAYGVEAKLGTMANTLGHSMNNPWIGKVAMNPITWMAAAGTGNLAANLHTNPNMDDGQKISAFAKGAIIGGVARYAFSPTGFRHLGQISGNLAHYASGEATTVTLGLFSKGIKLGTFIGPEALVADSAVGAAEWLIVSPAFTVGAGLFRGVLGEQGVIASSWNKKQLVLDPILNPEIDNLAISNANDAKTTKLFSSDGDHRMRLWIKDPLAILAAEAERGIVVEGAEIVECVARGRSPTVPPDTTFNASRHVVLPGLVNAHHHFYQTLTRAHPSGFGKELIPWLVSMERVWDRMNSEALRIAIRMALVELMLSGCTTAADHHNLFPPNLTNAIDIEVEEATKLGLRMTVTRGSMGISEKDGGLQPDSIVQDSETILEDSERVLRLYHDARPGAMIRVALAPCSPLAVPKRVMVGSAELAERYDCRLHTHLCQSLDEDVYAVETFGVRSVDLLEQAGWLSPRTWVAHGIHFNASEIERLGKAQISVCHCAASDMAFGMGVCPTRELEAAGVAIGLGVDGSASNDSSNMMEAVRHSLMLQRLSYGPSAVTPYDALRWATQGSAHCLGRDDIGAIAPGMQADLALFTLDEPRFSGAQDPIAALALCGAHRAERVMVAGQWRVIDGEPEGVDLPALIAKHKAAARAFA